MRVKKTKCDLKSCSMCRGCQPEWLKAIAINRQVLQYKKGEELFIEGNAVTGMYFILSGLVKVHKKWGDNKELIVRFANAGAIAGHRGLGADTIYPVSATALSNTEVCYVDLDFFIATLKVNPGYLFELMMFFAAELKESEKRMRNLAHMSTKGRISQALLNLNTKFGTDENGFIDIDLSRQDLASYSGTTYETLFKMLNEMAEENILKLVDKKIAIADINKLTLVSAEGS
jgi:CRP-like cAMP-binding protein